MPQGPQVEQWPTKQGLEVVTYPDGSPKVSAHYDEGILSGEFKSWYPNGQVRFIRQYQQGKRVGVETVYYQDGSLYSQGDYRHGNYKTYHPNGRIQLAKDSLESDGSHHYYRWNSAGILIESVPLVNGKMEGLHQYWSAKNELMAQG